MNASDRYKASSMISKTYKIFFILVLLTSAVYSQTFDGPTEVCQNVGESYTYYDDVLYNSISWSTTGGGTLSPGSGLTRTVSWSSSGSVTVELYYNGNLVSTGTKNVTVFIASTIYGPSQVCTGNSVTLTRELDQYGAYVWEISTNSGGSWSSLGSAASLNHTPTVNNSQYRLRLTSCSSNNLTNVITVAINPLTVGGTLSASTAEVCNSATITLTQSGHTGVVEYWYARSRDGAGAWSSWTSYSAANTSTQTYSVTTNGTVSRTYEFYNTIRSGYCPQQNSSTASVTVYPQTNAGTLSVSAAQVCNTGTVSLSLSGYVGAISQYQMRSRIGAGTWSGWSACSNSVSVSASGSSTQSYEFKAIVQSGTCASAESTIPSVIVYPNTAGGSLSPSASEICASATVTLTLSGYVGDVTNWQVRSKDGAGAWSGWSSYSTVNTNAQSYSVTTNGSVSRTYEFINVVQSGNCSTLNSTTASLTVYPQTNPGTLSVSASQVCNSGTISLSVSGNIGSINQYQVRSRIGAGSWSAWSACTTSVAVSASGNDTQTYEFKALVQSGMCASLESNIPSVIAYPNTTGGNLSASASQVCGSATATLSLSGYVGNVTDWQVRSKDGEGAWSGWSSYSTTNASSQPYSVTTNGSLSRTYEFMNVVQSGTCTAQNSTSVSLTVYPGTAGGSISPSAVEDYGISSGTLTLSGYVGNVQRWEQNSGSGWTNITNPTATQVYSNLTQSTSYRAAVKSGTCAETYSSQTTIAVYAVPTISLGQIYIPYGTTTTISTGSFYSYQWIKNGVDIAGATTASLTVAEPGDYQVRVKGSASASPYTSGITQIKSNLAEGNVNLKSITRILKEGVNANTNLYSLQAQEVQQVLDFQDGLGRTFQIVGVGQSPAGKDIVQPAAYSALGLAETSYLPYATALKDGRKKPDAIRGSDLAYNSSEQYQFYQTASKVAHDTHPYAVKILASTPLASLKEQGAPGADWQPGTSHTIRKDLLLNTTNQVRYWKTDGTTNSYYSANSLLIDQTTDENGNLVRTFSDKLGRTLLKQVQLNETINGSMVNWLDTYYIYDEYGRIKYQVPPKAMDVLGTGSTLNANNSTVAELIFKYIYDERGRLTEKKVPGAATQYVVYDQLDRVAFTQDGNLRSLGKWSFVKYDKKGRTIYSGLYTSSADRITLQGQMDAIDYNTTVWYETEQVNATYQGYSNMIFPTTNLQVLSVNYYDHYDFDRNSAADYTYGNTHLTGSASSASTQTRGLPTGSKTLILGSTNWLTSYVFYDKFSRVLQTRSNNHLSLTIDNLSTVIYDFAGKVLTTKTSHNAGGSNQTTLVKKIIYDNAGRPLKIYQNINNEPHDHLVAKYNYNELGQTIEKNLHLLYDSQDGQAGIATAENLVLSQYDNESAMVARNSITFEPGFDTGPATLDAYITTITQAQAEANGRYMQSVDYRYNIRGWLESINNAKLEVAGNNDDTNDYFGMELMYNTTTGGPGNTPYYNGNISAIKWKGPGQVAGTPEQRSYKYVYDKTDKLKTATFQAYGGSAWDKEINTLNENLSYDHNGNMLTLSRNKDQKGFSGGVTHTAQAIDNLTYTYAAGNQLSKVEDAVSGTEGFMNGSTATTEYTYNTNGSLTTDANKGITGITYNELGKPAQITFANKTIQYTYDASGNKLKMVVNAGSAVTTDYVGEFVYENNVLSFFSSPEGRVVKNGSNLEYQYAIADHQGNTRVVFSSATPATKSYQANMEATSNSDFQNYPTGGNRSGLELFDHTDFSGSTYTYSNLLNGGISSQVGVAKTFKVYPGDKVKIEAYAKYYNPQSNSSNLPGFASALLSAFSLPAPAPGEIGTASAGLNNWGTVVAGGGGNATNGYPRGYVNILVFDKHHNLLDVAYQQIDGGEQVGASPKAAHDYMEREYTAREEGYMYVYISNESPTLVDIYFDDVTITHSKTNVIQYNEYYPFGLQTATSWTRENALGNNFLYNAGNELNNGTGLYEMFFRNYDPALGRMNGVDPMADIYGSLTPYNYAFNDPVFWNDPFGADPVQRIGDDFIINWDEVGENGGIWSSSGGEWYGYNSSWEAWYAGAEHNERFGSWGAFGGPGSWESSAQAYSTATGEPVPLRHVEITIDVNGNYHGEPYWNNNWLQWRIDETYPADFSQQTEKLHEMLDVLGTGDPTGFIDLFNGLVYLGQGDVANASISGLAIIPYFGDAAKAGRVVLKTIPWSSKALGKTAKLLEKGATSVTVANKAEAEELFLGLYQGGNGKSFINTTGLSATETKSLHGSKTGTYHWDLNDTQHGGIPHLQIHDFDGSVIRIFFNQ